MQWTTNRNTVRTLDIDESEGASRDAIKLAALEAAADCHMAGIMLLDPEGAPLFVNRAMMKIAERRDGLSLDDKGRLRTAGAEERVRVNALVEGVRGGEAGGLVRVPRAFGGTPYVIRVAPARLLLQFSVSPWPNANCAVLVVHDPESPAPLAEDILRQGLGLPPAAARLVAALAADDDLKSYAKRAGITISTVRFHLRSALTRTGARSQAQLVRIAVRMLRDIGFGADRV
jgi:DNA-binding CsgD family transcriptional regulator